MSFTIAFVADWGPDRYYWSARGLRKGDFFLNGGSEMPKVTRLKIRMLERGITQRRLAEQTGINRAQICWISQGRLMPDDRQKQKIARALKADVQELFS